jgi:hypothetical protein
MSKPKPVPDDVIEAAWQRCREGHKNLQPYQGICECTNAKCSHSRDPVETKKNPNGCERIIKWDQRGGKHSDRGWEAHHIGPQDDEPTLKNCRILCCDCHEQTDTYGKH